MANDITRTATTESSHADEEVLKSLPDIRPLYFLPSDPLAEEILIPSFRAADKVDCMVGFFSSAVLAALAPGLASYIAGTPHSFRLIISPFLRLEDQAAIEEGVRGTTGGARGR